ncbi:MAG: AbrB/MazE/SpoVT family DNA-binding domain-containing protein [Anaerovoracaceae bacterium]
MKATGIVRKIDNLGRVVIPKEIRRTFGMPEGTPLEIYVGEKGEIILAKYLGDVCIFCEENDGNLQIYKNKRICGDCIKGLK